MGEYTNHMDIRSKKHDVDEEIMLYETAKEFRSFDKAFVVFLLEHGYTGDVTNIKAMAKLVRTKFTEVGVPHVDNFRFRDLFNPQKRRSRETAFKICFAFRLNIQETNDFFRRVMLERGIDCHAINEAVYYFGIKNGLTYAEVESIKKQIPRIECVEKIPKDDILYTSSIEGSIESISEKEELIKYIADNIECFRYKNAKATELIQALWSKIKGENGLAKAEAELIDEMLNPFHPDRSKKTEEEGETRIDEVVAEEVAREKELEKDDYVVDLKGKSTWSIYCQIMGLDKQQERFVMLNSADRSLSPVFKDNVLLPLMASDCFPSRQSIDEIIRGQCDGEYEKFRKLLIFFVFYTFWAKIIKKENNVFYCANHIECDRCKEDINKYLLEAGYSELYPGNPYDWIFLWALNDEHPLDTFRIYMREVYIANPLPSKGES